MQFHRSHGERKDPKIERYRELIDSYFQENHHFSKYSFKGMFKNQIRYIVVQFFNIIVYYFDRYTEQMFHDRMKGQYILTIKPRTSSESYRQVKLEGFDFLKDWKTHHKAKFAFFIQAVNAQKDNFTFDEDKIFEILLEILKVKGWTISEREQLSIKQTVRRLYNILYLNWDSVD